MNKKILLTILISVLVIANLILAWEVVLMGNSIRSLEVSGIRGRVTLGPICPVERTPPDPNCADKPYQTQVMVFRAGDMAHAFLVTKSDASGTFAVYLPPGQYTLGAGEGKFLPRCDRPQVTVTQNTVASATIHCDTGIR